MKEYELMVLLHKGRGENIQEWHESTTVKAKGLAEAKTMAWRFARSEAWLADAKVTDAYAIDMETYEQSQ
jgi:hypothetical protein